MVTQIIIRKVVQVIIRKVSYYVLFRNGMQVITHQPPRWDKFCHLQGCTQFTDYHP
jgi:hypothetical protein